MSLVIARGLFPGNRGGGGSLCSATGYPLLNGQTAYVGSGYPVPLWPLFVADSGGNPSRPLVDVEMRASNNTTILVPKAPKETATYTFLESQEGNFLFNVWGYNCKAGDFVQLIADVQASGYTAGAPRFALYSYSVELPFSGQTIGDVVPWHADDDENTVWTVRHYEGGGGIIAQGGLDEPLVWNPAPGDYFVTVEGANGAAVTLLATSWSLQDNA